MIGCCTLRESIIIPDLARLYAAIAACMALWLVCFHAGGQAQAVSGQPHTLHRAEYAYDENGARTTARITRAATPSAEEVNVWSQWNSYNQLGQLKETLFGSLSGGTISAPLLQDSWSLDALGNWNDLPNAGVSPVGRLTTDYRPGTPAIRQITDATDARNRIDARTDSSVGSQEIAYTYDSAGNLRSDGAFFYQYDAWNRLVQVNEAIANQGFTEPGPGADENPVAAQERWWPGRMLKHYKYDGLGRLIETQSPYPDVETAMGRLRTERFYYDGVRRIQEVVTDPLLMLGLAAESGNPELQQAVANAAPAGEVAADPQTATLESEEVQMLGGEWLPATVTTLHREYVWGPGDRGVGGVDELLVQFDAARKAWWMLVDGGGDVVAMCERVGSGSSAYAAVAAQWTYDAYGAVIDEDVFDAAAPVNRAGHKGLFADRLDVGVVDEWGHENCRLIPGAELAFYNRNRTYSPYLGRFLQSDPNATGKLLVHDLPLQGQSQSPSVHTFDLSDRFRDGANLYQYLGSNTWDQADPTGLFVGGVAPFMPGASDFISGMLESLVQDYSANLEWDAEWAMEWSLPDDDHSRMDDLWIALALGRGLYDAFEIGIGDYSFNPLDMFASASKGRSRGTGGPGGANVKNGNTVSAKRGKDVHTIYKHVLAAAGMPASRGWRFEVTIPRVGRLDALNMDLKTIRELKPDTPSGRAKGHSQVRGYLEKITKEFGGTWTGYVDYYRH